MNDDDGTATSGAAFAPMDIPWMEGFDAAGSRSTSSVRLMPDQPPQSSDHAADSSQRQYRTSLQQRTYRQRARAKKQHQMSSLEGDVQRKLAQASAPCCRRLPRSCPPRPPAGPLARPL
jgi:hypothetical protein